METLREKAFHKYHCTVFQWIHEMSNSCIDVLKGNYDAELFGEPQTCCRAQNTQGNKPSTLLSNRHDSMGRKENYDHKAE